MAADPKELDAFSNWVSKFWRFDRIQQRWFTSSEVDTDDLKPGKTIKELYEDFEKQYKPTI